jgi:hypothetical protein
MKDSTVHIMNFPYTRQELLALFTLAVNEDVEKGGRYDARSNAINIWSHPWTPRAMRQESTIMGTFHCVWGVENRIYRIDADAGFSLHDLLQELGTLELKALGLVKHGTRPTPLAPVITSKKHF